MRGQQYFTCLVFWSIPALHRKSANGNINNTCTLPTVRPACVFAFCPLWCHPHTHLPHFPCWTIPGRKSIRHLDPNWFSRLNRVTCFLFTFPGWWRDGVGGQRETETERQRQTETDRPTDRQTETDRQTDWRQTYRQTERKHRKRQTDRRDWRQTARNRKKTKAEKLEENNSNKQREREREMHRPYARVFWG